MVSLTFFIFIPFCRIPTILGKKVLSDPADSSLFICTFRMSSLLERLEQIQAWINMLGPCIVHFLSNILTCISIVRRKVSLSHYANSHLTYRQAWLQQISLHRDYFISPLVILLCQLPHLIFFAITNTIFPCLEVKLGVYSHLHILSALLINIPQILTFIIFIYPSKFEFLYGKYYWLMPYNSQKKIKSDFYSEPLNFVKVGAFYEPKKMKCTNLAIIQSKVTELQAHAANYQNKTNELEKEATAAKKQADEKLEQLKRKYDSI
ncbi:unnamed protein product [Rotaria sp. Silwood1]|nr:unnamed protein product [Rotaria sp. Silwood1]